jgi:PAS domain S-box-containing protein
MVTNKLASKNSHIGEPPTFDADSPIIPDHQWRTVVESAAPIVMIADLNETIIYINRVVDGYDKQEVTGKRLEEYLPPGQQIERMKKIFRQVVETGQTFSTDVSVINPMGQTLYFQSTYSPIQEKGQLARVAIWTTEVTKEKQAEMLRQEALRRLVEAQENERRNVSHELHDDIGHALTTLILRNQKMLLKTEDPSLVDDINEIQAALKRTIKQLGQIARGIHPGVIEDLGLAEALRQLVDEVKSLQHIKVDYQTMGELDGLPIPVAITFYRTIQEALNNVIKHAQASEVSIVVMLRDEHLIANIEDNGVGIKGNASSSQGLGLTYMNEKMGLFNGSLDIESTLGKGTSIQLHIPIKPWPELS